MNPDADLIIMSKADAPGLAAMTQNAIDTALDGAPGLDVNVLVMEQCQLPEYARATTVYAPQTFNYNRFANWAMNAVNSRRAVIANNDLLFHPGWLRALIAADYPIVSPVDPDYPRQRGIDRNERGTLTGRHLAGWCFMIDRNLWQRIGGFDETYAFWCSDDALIEQLTRIDVPPMAVPAAQVTHLLSRTLYSRDQDEQDDLTWKQVHRFNQASGAQLGASNPRYLDWQRRNADEMSS